MLLPVEFQGQTLLAGRRDADGDVLVAVRPICRNIGVDWTGQRQRILRDPVLAEGVVMITTPSAGGPQNALCIPIRLLNGWLFGIDSRRVRPEIRDRVIAYQRECYDVLWRHFQPSAPVMPDPAGDGAGLDDDGPDRPAVEDIELHLRVVREIRATHGRRAAASYWQDSPLRRLYDPQAMAVADVDGDGDAAAVARFLRERLCTAPGDFIAGAALYAAYRAWAGDGAMNATRFGRLAGQHLRKMRCGTVRYQDVRLQ